MPDNVLVCDPHGEPLRTTADVLDLIGEAWSAGANWVAVPAGRLPDDFFALRSGVAGEITQKFANYRIGLAIVGDVSSRTAGSTALNAWVTEANRGGQLWFVRDEAELRSRLAVSSP
ncbi:DUF4180 domain-containing protein [Nonomuraea candida]|uniref:DUF4180 domain-containing protein n=1 Tax=Nonomuraea candida TaxID=359159 RepID=UPI0005B87E6D|nr:DUF4180 domain-containing protein [Nonomuraea candida]